MEFSVALFAFAVAIAVGFYRQANESRKTDEFVGFPSGFILPFSLLSLFSVYWLWWKSYYFILDKSAWILWTVGLALMFYFLLSRLVKPRGSSLIAVLRSYPIMVLIFAIVPIGFWLVPPLAWLIISADRGLDFSEPVVYTERIEGVFRDAMAVTKRQISKAPFIHLATSSDFEDKIRIPAPRGLADEVEDFTHVKMRVGAGLLGIRYIQDATLIRIDHKNQ